MENLEDFAGFILQVTAGNVRSLRFHQFLKVPWCAMGCGGSFNRPLLTWVWLKMNAQNCAFWSTCKTVSDHFIENLILGYLYIRNETAISYGTSQSTPSGRSGSEFCYQKMLKKTSQAAWNPHCKSWSPPWKPNGGWNPGWNPLRRCAFIHVTRGILTVRGEFEPLGDAGDQPWMVLGWISPWLGPCHHVFLENDDLLGPCFWTIFSNTDDVKQHGTSFTPSRESTIHHLYINPFVVKRGWFCHAWHSQTWLKGRSARTHGQLDFAMVSGPKFPLDGKQSNDYHMLLYNEWSLFHDTSMFRGNHNFPLVPSPDRDFWVWFLVFK